MDISTIQHIAKLSYLEFSDEELAYFAKDLSAIIDYVSELNTAPISDSSLNIAPHSFSRNVFRDDDGSRDEDAELVMALMSAVPEREDGYVKVKAIL